MEKARVVNETYYASSRFQGIQFGIMVFLIGILFLLRDLGYIATKISFWTYFFLIIGFWLILRKLF